MEFLSLYGFFAAGQLIHILRRASAAVRSAANPIKSRRQYLATYWDIFLVRAVFAGSLFALWVSSPDAIANLTGANIRMPINPATTLLAGLTTDMLLDWFSQKIPGLGREIPTLPNGNGHPQPPAQ